MTKHQKQAHDLSLKQPCLQWRPLNEILSAGRKQKASRALSWKPLDEVLQKGTLLRQQLSEEKNKVAIETIVNWDMTAVNDQMNPASPVFSEKSSATVDDDLIIYDAAPQNFIKMDHWCPSNQPLFQYPPNVNDTNNVYLNYPSFHML